MSLKFGLKLNQIDFVNAICHQPSGVIYPYKKPSKKCISIVKRSFAQSFEEFLDKMAPVIVGFGHDHESILPIYGFHVKCDEPNNPQRWYINVKMPMIQETLKEKIDRLQEIPENDIETYIYSLACGLEYLHAKKIPHGDLNLDNIVFDIHGNIKIMGMRNLRATEDEIPNEYFSYRGYYLYSPPELQDRKKERKRKDLIMGDLWALGIIIAQLCSFEVRSINFSVTGGELEKQLEKLEIKSKKLKRLIKSLLKYEAGERIQLKEIKNILNEQENNKTNKPGIEMSKDDKKNNIIFKFNLDINKIKTSDPIVIGACGTIYPDKSDQDNGNYVVKVIPKKKLNEALEYIKEIALGLSCDHSCVLPVKGFALEEFEEIWYIYIKIPTTRESLKDRIERWAKRRIQDFEKLIVSFFYNITLGLEYLHKKGIVHNNIKPQNILFDHDDQIKISGLGTGEYIENESSQEDCQNSNSIYSAPELTQPDQEKNDRFKADIWSLGIVIAELYGVTPVNPNSIDDIELYYTKNLKEKIFDGVLLDLIRNILKYRPEERLSLEKIKNILESHFPYLNVNKNKSNKIDSESQDQEQIIEDKISTYNLEKTRKELERNFGFYFNFTTEAECGIKIELNSHQKKDQKAPLSDLLKKMTELKGDIHNKKLKDFTQDFLQFSPNTHNMIKNLSSQIEFYLRDLQHLSIDFSGCDQIKDETIEHLSKEIRSKIINLKHLSVNLSSCKQLTPISIEKLADVIRYNHSSIRNLCFDFSWNNISSNAIKNLAKSVEKNLTKLNHLSLKLAGCAEIFEDVIECIGNKPLKSLYMNFSWNEKIKDETIQKITTQIQQNFKDLQRLNLQFYSCYEITEQSVTQSIKRLSQFDNLKELILDFSNCEKIPKDIILESNELQDGYKKLNGFKESVMTGEFKIKMQKKD